MSAISVTSDLRSSIAAQLAEARERTLLLVDGISEEDLLRQHDPLMSPILWDLGHIAHFEKLWLTQNLDGPIEFSEMPGMYNPFEHPRATRASLPLPPLTQMKLGLAQIRETVLDRLERTDFDEDNPLLADGYVYNMVLQHEYQHNETILQTLQLKLGEPYHPRRRYEAPAGGSTENGMVSVPGGEYTIGTTDRSAAYDNERPLHTVVARPFRIDRNPVSNGEYMEFMRDGGYKREEFWSQAGRAWLTEKRLDSPGYWKPDGTGWTTRTMDREGPVDENHPVCHVCYYEAEAFAKWAGKRLPTEVEWEIAASADPSKASRRFPWGNQDATPSDANIDQLMFGTTPRGAYPRNVSPLGCYGMIGDVWEWTSSDFTGYPGYESFPYREYSEVFFGSEYKVLRGGSWATRPGAIRNTFRNWDYPIRRQIFSGFRCASDD